MDATAWTGQLQSLLPTGAAWTRAPDATLTGVLAGLAAEFARLDTRALDLLDEADPRTTLELLDGWERVLGLPDGCTPYLGTLTERRLAVVQKLAGLGGQTPAFFVALAAFIGLPIVIHEFDPDVGTYIPGIDVSGGRWRLVWRIDVQVPSGRVRFRAGTSGAGDRLTEGGQLDLECIIRRAKPAHTLAIFTYPEA